MNSGESFPLYVVYGGGVIIGLFLTVYIAWSIKTGRVHIGSGKTNHGYKVSTVLRSEKPRLFWFVLVFYVYIDLMIVATLIDIQFPLKLLRLLHLIPPS